MLRLLIACALPLGVASAYSNPFCGATTSRDAVSVSLECAPGSGAITAVTFAAYGTPDLSQGCGSYHYNVSCNLAGYLATAQQACIGKTSCTLEVDHSSTDPCPYVVKTIAVQATCASAPGGQQVPSTPPYPVVPSCATQNGVPPCPLPVPPWTPTWALNRSTICQPGNTPGFLNATQAARFGLISLDWSIANNVWRPAGTPCNATTGAAVLVEQCRQIQAVDPTTKCFVYRNTELALEWLEPQREVMLDPTKADWFLQYQPGNPKGVAPGTIYNEYAGGPGSGCRQFFWNYSNPDAVEWVVRESEEGPLATGSPFVKGTFLDDAQSIPTEHGDAPVNMGITPTQLQTLQNDSHKFVQTAITSLAAAGKYIWQGFDGNRGGDPDYLAPGVNRGDCLAWMTEVCDPSWQRVPMTVQWDGRNTTMAGFLIGRGPIAYVGWGWNGGPVPEWDALFDLDVGEPTGLCTTPSPGVFSRQWSKGVATLDCNSFTATLDF